MKGRFTGGPGRYGIDKPFPPCKRCGKLREEHRVVEREDGRKRCLCPDGKQYRSKNYVRAATSFSPVEVDILHFIVTEVIKGNRISSGVLGKRETTRLFQKVVGLKNRIKEMKNAAVAEKDGKAT